MSKWYDDKDNVKDVFDSIRNYIYCGVLFYAGVVNFTETSESNISKLLFLFLGIAFCLIAIYLFIVNTIIIFKTINSKSKSVFARIVLTTIVSLVVVQFGLFMLTHESTKVKMEDGTSVGELKVPKLLVPNILSGNEEH